MKKPRSENAIDYEAFKFPKNAPVRLAWGEMKKLRLECMQRDKGRCRECRVGVTDRLPDWHPLKAHIAHIQGRGANGGDVIGNVLLLCGDCHRRQHQGETLRCMEEARAAN